MSGINIKIGTISTKFHYPYEGIFGKATPPEYIIKEATGNGYINLTNAVANRLMELKAYGGTEQRNLPSGYTELDGIIGDGTAYIDLNCILDQDDEIELYFTNPQVLQSKSVFGARSTVSSKNISILCASTGNIVLDINDSDYTDYRLNQAISTNTMYKAVINKNGRYVYNGDTLVGSNTTPCLDVFETDGCYLFNIFGGGYASKYNGIINKCVIKGKRELIPCKNSNNEVGMYDVLNGVFYGNADITGSFTAGTETTPKPDKPMDMVSNNGVLKFSKNIANVNTQTALVGYYISTSGQVLESPYNRIYQEYIPCKPNTTYTLSMSSAVYYVTISEYSTAEDSGFVRRNAGITGGNTQLTITTRSNTNYLRFGANLSSSNITIDDVLAINWQLEKGNTPTPYHEYVEGGIYTEGTTETISSTLSNVTAEMLLKIGDVIDEQEILSGAITRKIGVKVLDGTETRSKTAARPNTYVSSQVITDRDISNRTTFCSHFISTDVNDNLENPGYFVVGASTQTISFSLPTSITSGTAFSEWLADQYIKGTPVIILYVLATPTTESVEGQTMNIPKGDSTIEITQTSIDNLGLYAKYKATA